MDVLHDCNTENILFHFIVQKIIFNVLIILLKKL